MADVASRKTANMPKKRAPSVANSAQTLERKPSEAPKSVVASVAESAEHEKSESGDFETVTNAEGEEEEEEEEYEDDDGTEEAVPAGSVDYKGDVINEAGKVVGHVTGDKASNLEGSIVDQEGDVLDKEGNVIGSASLLEGLSQGEDAESVLKKPMQEVDPSPEEDATSKVEHTADEEKPELNAPFGVQDNGEITNAKGGIIGKITQGSPQELVGTSIKEIDHEGNLKVESGSVVGHGEIQPELLEAHTGLTEDAVSKLGSKVDGASAVGSQLPDQEKIGEKSAVASHVPSKVNGASALGSKHPGDSVVTPDESASQVGEKVEGAKSAVGSQLPEGVDQEGPEVPTSQLGDKVKGGSAVDSKLSKAGEMEGASAVDSKLSKAGELEGGSAVGSKLSKAGELGGASAIGSKVSKVGSQLPEEPELDSEGKPIPQDLKLDADGKPIETTEEPQLDAEGNPIPEDLKLDADGKPIEKPEEPELDAEGKPIVEEPKLDAEGKPIETPEEPQLDAEGNEIPESEREKLDEGVALPEEIEKPDLSILKGKKVNKIGKIVDENGNPFGQLAEGYDVKKLVGKKVDAEGNIWDDSGKVIGRAELLPEDEREAEPSAPFEDFPDSVLDGKGNVIFQGQVVGKLIEGDAKKLEGKKVDADGDVLDKNGNVLGKAERYQEEEAVPEEPVKEEKPDLSLLEGKKVNKVGNVVDDQGKLFGHVTTGVLAKLVGKKCDAEGKIWGEAGKVIGTAELIPAEDRDQASIAEFEDFPGAVVDRHGNILFEGQIVGKLVEGEARKLVGKKIDQDGEIVDRLGNVLGRAERWVEEDAPPEPEPEKVDMSALAGKRVNKAGNLVDGHGDIYGILVEGDAKKLAGRMADKNGHVFDEGGNIVGRAELVPESERSGQKEGPFAGFASPTVTKDGKVADIKGSIIGRLIEGDAKKLYGKEVDPDGDVLDKNGNTLGKAERWEEEVKPEATSPVKGRKVNREGNVVDENGDLIAKLTEGEVTKCAGKEIDADGDVYNSKGSVIGHVTLLDEIPAPEPVAELEPEPEVEEEVEEEPQETEEEKQERLLKEQDRKLAGQMAMCIQGSLDNINPVLRMISDAINSAERQKPEDLDEQKLVDTVKPLIEQGHQILMEANGVIRGLDPDGHIAAQAKGRSGSGEATPEEHRLAEVLKELTGNVTKTIENAKKKIAGMPHAKKELNPLWGLLAEPLGQILAAVGLLLAGVLGLVGRLLSGLGLGGLLDNLLGGLGLKGILKGLGLGMVTESLTGRK